MRAGRNRPARPSWWELHPERWPRRSLNGREAGFVTNGDLAMVAKPATPPMVDGREAGLLKTPMVAKLASPHPELQNPELRS